MGIKIGILGIGQAGANIADVAHGRGIPVFAINTSQEDLDAVSFKHNRVLIGNKGGTAKDRKLAVSEFRDYYKSVLENIKNWAITEQLEVIITSFSTGGGTGSGIGPVICRIMNETFNTTTTIAMPILASNTESIGALANSIECMSQLMGLSIPMIIVDNQKIKDATSKRKLFNAINSEAIDNIQLLSDINSKNSKYGNIDKRDLLRIISTPGMLSFSIIFEELLNGKKNVADVITNSIDSSIYAPVEYDKKISCLSIIAECNDSMLEKVTQTELYSLLGQPLEVYEGIYAPEEGDEGRITLILSGLSYPITRINQMKARVAQDKDTITKRDLVVNFDAELDWFKSIRTETKTGNIQIQSPKEAAIPKQEPNIESMFDDYF